MTFWKRKPKEPVRHNVRMARLSIILDDQTTAELKLCGGYLGFWWDHHHWFSAETAVNSFLRESGKHRLIDLGERIIPLHRVREIQVSYENNWLEAAE